MGIGYNDRSKLESVWIAFPKPDFRKCHPRVRSAQFGFVDLSYAGNNLGFSHFPYEQYFHKSVVDELKEEIEILRQWGNKECIAMADEQIAKIRK